MSTNRLSGQKHQLDSRFQRESVRIREIRTPGREISDAHLGYSDRIVAEALYHGDIIVSMPKDRGDDATEYVYLRGRHINNRLRKYMSNTFINIVIDKNISYEKAIAGLLREENVVTDLSHEEGEIVKEKVITATGGNVVEIDSILAKYNLRIEKDGKKTIEDIYFSFGSEILNKALKLYSDLFIGTASFKHLEAWFLRVLAGFYLVYHVAGMSTEGYENAMRKAEDREIMHNCYWRKPGWKRREHLNRIFDSVRMQTAHNVLIEIGKKIEKKRIRGEMPSIGAPIMDAKTFKDTADRISQNRKENAFKVNFAALAKGSDPSDSPLSVFMVLAPLVKYPSEWKCVGLVRHKALEDGRVSTEFARETTYSIARFRGGLAYGSREQAAKRLCQVLAQDAREKGQGVGFEVDLNSICYMRVTE